MTALQTAHESSRPDRRELLLISTMVIFSIVVYPFILNAFHFSVGSDDSTSLSASMIMLSILWMGSAFAVPAVCLCAAIYLSNRPVVSAEHQKVLRLCYFGVVAPTAYVFMGVLLYMAAAPISDEMAWVFAWLAIGAWTIVPTRKQTLMKVPNTVSPRLRVGHGIVSTAILIYVLFHLVNHLMGLLGPGYHAAFMEIGRSVYRATIVEPILVALMLCQVASGIMLAWRWSGRQAEAFRVFQVMSGIYLSVYILGHMNSVFFYARSFLEIETDWGFATGAPTGLIHDPWNIRLIPHYWLGAFLVLSHAVFGLLVVLKAHNVQEISIRRIRTAGLVVSGVVTTFIILGMCGLRIGTLI